MITEGVKLNTTITNLTLMERGHGIERIEAIVDALRWHPSILSLTIGMFNRCMCAVTLCVLATCTSSLRLPVGTCYRAALCACIGRRVHS